MGILEAPERILKCRQSKRLFILNEQFWFRGDLDEEWRFRGILPTNVRTEQVCALIHPTHFLIKNPVGSEYELYPE